MAGWIQKRLAPPPLWDRPLLDLRYALEYVPAVGFAVAADAASRLGRLLPCVALLSATPPGALYQDHPVSDDVKARLLLPEACCMMPLAAAPPRMLCFLSPVVLICIDRKPRGVMEAVARRAISDA